MSPEAECIRVKYGLFASEANEMRIIVEREGEGVTIAPPGPAPAPLI